VQTDANDSKPVATLFELGRAIAGTDASQVRKEWASLWEASQDFRDFLSKVNNGQGSSLCAGIRNGLILPINVLSTQVGHVALRAAQVPAKFVEAFPFRILLAFDAQAMFRKRDSTFIFEFDLRKFLRLTKSIGQCWHFRITPGGHSLAHPRTVTDERS